MSTTMFIAVALLVLAGLANGLMDTLAFHFTKDNYLWRFKSNWFGNPADTWVNKYKNYPEDQSPKYWGATTFLSFTTDAWHFFKFFQLQAFKLIPVILFPIKITSIHILDYIIVFIGVTITLAVGFHFTYTLLNKFFHGKISN